jgi:hypothetical protein
MQKSEANAAAVEAAMPTKPTAYRSFPRNIFFVLPGSQFLFSIE